MDKHIEKELQTLKPLSIEKMAERVEKLETILEDKEREEISHDYI